MKLMEINTNGIIIGNVEINCKITPRLNVVYGGDEISIMDYLKILIDDMYNNCTKYERYMFFKTNNVILKDIDEADKLYGLLVVLTKALEIDSADKKRLIVGNLLDIEKGGRDDQKSNR